MSDNKIVHLNLVNDRNNLMINRIRLFKELELENSKSILINFLQKQSRTSCETFVNQYEKKLKIDMNYTFEEYLDNLLASYLKDSNLEIINRCLENLILDYNRKTRETLVKDNVFDVCKSGENYVKDLYYTKFRKTLSSEDLSTLYQLVMSRKTLVEVEDESLKDFYKLNDKSIKEHLVTVNLSPILKREFFERLENDVNVLGFYLPTLTLFRNEKSKYKYDISGVLRKHEYLFDSYCKNFDNRIWGFRGFLNNEVSNTKDRILIVSNVKELLDVTVIINKIEYRVISDTFAYLLNKCEKINMKGVKFINRIYL